MHVHCTERFPSFVGFDWGLGRFGLKQAFLGHKMRSFVRAPPDLAPRGATNEFVAQNMGLARAPPRL